jgi:DNA-binding NarL/FixJ family response regulator
MSLRLLIVDDNASFLTSASAILQRGGLDVVATASSASVALEQAEELRPDVVLVDIHLAGESGFDLARQLHAARPGERQVVLMSTHAEEDFADLIEASPAVGFVAKSRLCAPAIRSLLSDA